MDPIRFDRLTQSLGRAASRRAAFAALAALGLAASETAVAKPKKKACPPCKRRKRHKCKPAPDGTACGAGGRCVGGVCQAACGNGQRDCGDGVCQDCCGNNDVPDDDNPCTNNVCDHGQVSYPPLQTGAACPGGVCDGAGTCVPCNAGASCGTGRPGVCSVGTFDCSSGGPVCVATTGPQPELCDGLDNDCDGVVDNGFDLMHDVDNCGQCGNVCHVTNGVAGCVAGQCVIVACKQGWADCDLYAQNGCETELGKNTNCGFCGDVCGAGKTCVDGTCVSS